MNQQNLMRARELGVRTATARRRRNEALAGRHESFFKAWLRDHSDRETPQANLQAAYDDGYRRASAHYPMAL